jgi:hypothetical protein
MCEALGMRVREREYSMEFYKSRGHSHRYALAIISIARFINTSISISISMVNVCWKYHHYYVVGTWQ